MKKFRLLLIITLTFLLFNSNVFAASGSISVNKSKIENGSSVTATVSISGAAAWNISIMSSGATSGCNQKFADSTSNGANTSKSFSVTCKATAVGIIGFTLSGDITGEDGNTVKLSGSKSVNVTVPREKSTNNNLKSLGVEGYELSPAFDKNTKEYSVTVPSTVEKIKIVASKADSYASLSGDGEKDVTEGSNSFEIIVTSETGVENSYKINVSVEDINPIKVKVDKKEYTVVKVAKDLIKPELFEEKTIKIDEFDIPAFYNDIIKYTLVGLKDESGKVSLFIYKDKKYTKYNEFLSSRITLISLDNSVIPKGYKKVTVKLNEETVNGYKNGNSILIYGINVETGKKNYYSYDKNEKTLQLFDVKKYELDRKNTRFYKILIYLLSVVCLLMTILSILLGSKTKKIKKLISIEKHTKNKKDKKEK